jgi:glutathione synthase/RimK-type ligase-like ATP-grasp enzyme
MNYILLHWNYGRISMKMVVERMEQECNLIARKNNGEWWHYSPESKQWTIISVPIGELISRKNNIINWGNHMYRNDGYFRLNKPSSIFLASNKAESRIYLQNHHIAVPKTEILDNYVLLPVMNYPVIGRPPYHHAGKNFHVVENESAFTQFIKTIDLGWYFSEIFEKTHEFRVHCAHGKILQVSDKPLVEGEIRANQAVTEESWKALKWSEFNPKICEESLKAVEVLGLDYGAVDIMWNSKDNSVAICEVNTSPCITTEYSSGKYAAYFDWLIRHDFPAHFPIEGKSVFYNDILRS